MPDSPKTPRPKPRLGRGLSSLIGESTDLIHPQEQDYQKVTDSPSPDLDAPSLQTQHAAHHISQIPLDQIAPNPHQPRANFAQDQLAQLAESIKHQGILQPLIVSPASPASPHPYVLVAGERRLRAARHGALETVPCLVRQATPQQMLEWALVENIQRADLNPIERARGYRQYMDRFALTQAELAERLGEPRPTVANYLRLLGLSDAVQDMILDGKLTFGHAKILAGLPPDPEKQLALAKKVISTGLSVRELERLVAQSAPPTTVHAPLAPDKPRYIHDLEERLSHALRTRVRIVPGKKKNTGRLIVEYYSLDDFDRITEGLGLGGEEAH